MWVMVKRGWGAELLLEELAAVGVWVMVKKEWGRMRAVRVPLCRNGQKRMCVQANSTHTQVTSLQVYKFKFDLQPGSLTDQVAGEHQPSYKHP